MSCVFTPALQPAIPPVNTSYSELPIGKEHLERGSLCQPLVFCHLFSPIVDQGVAQRCGHMPECLREALSDTPRIRPVYPGQDDQAVARSTRVPTAEPLQATLIRSPSQWPGTVQMATSAGRSAIGVILGI